MRREEILAKLNNVHRWTEEEKESSLFIELLMELNDLDHAS